MTDMISKQKAVDIANSHRSKPDSPVHRGSNNTAKQIANEIQSLPSPKVDGDLVERLLAVDSSNDELGGDIGTNSYRNPDGPEAATALQSLTAERNASHENGFNLACDALMSWANNGLSEDTSKLLLAAVSDLQRNYPSIIQAIRAIGGG